MSGYALHPEAFAVLEEIWEFIAQDDIESADGVISDIFDAIRSLVNFPRQGTRRPDLTSQPLRFKRVRDYLIVYARPMKNPCG
jgi:plasmid stabilization system protein ParE